MTVIHNKAAPLRVEPARIRFHYNGGWTSWFTVEAALHDERIKTLEFDAVEIMEQLTREQYEGYRREKLFEALRKRTYQT